MNSYVGKKILVTGHTGFKGTWLTLILNRLGAEVVGISLKPKSNSMFMLFDKALKIKSYFIDICDFDKLESTIKEINPDGIFHLAAQSLVLDSYEDPLKTFKTNIIGTANLLQALKNASKTTFCILVTTDKVYRNDNSGKSFVESDPLGGIDPYSASKAASEIIIESMRRSFFQESNIKLVAARAGNVLGGGDTSSNRLLPDLIKSFVSNETCVIRHPNSIRPWQHVLEALVGYIIIGNKIFQGEKTSTEYNFGPSSKQLYKVIEMVRFVEKLWPSSTNIEVMVGKDAIYEASDLRLDSTKAKKELGWISTIDALKTIELTIQWELERLNGSTKSLLDFSNKQIDNYLAENTSLI
jgi:CDP-glucose 4,6-dehydratase